MKLSLQEGKKGNTKHAGSALARHAGQHSTILFFFFFFPFFQLNEAICSWIQDDESDGDFQVGQIHSTVVTPSYTLIFKCYLKI